jgi:predicted metal-dependent hydrolase
MFKELKDHLGIEGRVTLRFVPMKRKKASVSLRRKEIRINSSLLERMDINEMKHILIHELLHLKFGVYHSREFEKEFKQVYPFV